MMTKMKLFQTKKVSRRFSNEFWVVVVFNLSFKCEVHDNLIPYGDMVN